MREPERCPHCHSRFLFTDNICPRCKKESSKSERQGIQNEPRQDSTPLPTRERFEIERAAFIALSSFVVALFSMLSGEITYGPLMGIGVGVLMSSCYYT